MIIETRNPGNPRTPGLKPWASDMKLIENPGLKPGASDKKLNKIIMVTISSRLIINTKDIMCITGKSARSACRILTAIKKQRRKRPNGCITLHEFCSYMGLKEDYVRSLLR